MTQSDKETAVRADAAFPADGLLTVSPSPHIRARSTTSVIMADVLIALLPACVWGAYVFGTRALLLLAVCVASCIASEALCEWLLHRPFTLRDGSAAVTGVLLAMNLPVTLPLWMAALGSVFAIVLVKQIFGGIGKNFLNPALAGRVFLCLSFTTAMTNFTPAYTRHWAALNADAVAGATPLAALKAGELPADSLLDCFLGRTGGCIGEVSALLLLAGGIYLLVRQVIDWRIPLAYLGTVALWAAVFPRVEGAGVTGVLYELCTGGIMLGAIFMATDYVTSPTTRWGRVVFGIGCGLLTMFIRRFGGYAEGCSFAILIMNALVWYLDEAFRPRVFGVSKKKGGKDNG